MKKVPSISHEWVVHLVNEYGEEPRRVASESDQPFPKFPDLWSTVYAPRPTTADLRAVGSELWMVFAAASEAKQTERLNAFLERVELQPRLDSKGLLTWVCPRTGARDLLLATSSAAIVDAVTQLGWKRLGVCAGEDCVDVYIDDSGRRRRRFCSAACLNRARVRAHRRRRGDAAG